MAVPRPRISRQAAAGAVPAQGSPRCTVRAVVRVRVLIVTLGKSETYKETTRTGEVLVWVNSKYSYG